MIIEKPVKTATLCYHCGAECITKNIAIVEKIFCCEGCKLVYEILSEHGLCNYYDLQSHPGLGQIKPIRHDKYQYLDNEEIARKIYKFTDGRHVIVTFYIPGVHCSSCMWLLEHMGKMNAGIEESRLNFSTKELTIHFNKDAISVREIVELLATIDYEPYISLDDSGAPRKAYSDKARIYKLGIAGFCFGNIMMMSFPEYLSHSSGIEVRYADLFRTLNLMLSLPVFFYCASEFFISAWKALKQKSLNIDTPIALALIITFSRSLYEILSHTGSGYLDSMSGIVFFMLVGRVVQERAYRSISFNRDYKSYFPIAVSVRTSAGTESKDLQELKEKDLVELHHNEIVPADSIVVSGRALVDYSFVTGESVPVEIKEGDIVYAGGRQVEQQVLIQVIKPVAGSYLTSLWNHYAFKKDKSKQNDENSIIHMLSRYFTYILFSLAAITAIYWWMHDPSKILPSVSAMLIVACPCALLLSATYTNGNLLRILSNNGLFLRDAGVIEQLGTINHIVFDKTGTLTQGAEEFSCSGHELSEEETDCIYTVALSSTHPQSKALVSFLGRRRRLVVSEWKEIPGAGIEATIDRKKVRIGSAKFVHVVAFGDQIASVYTEIDEKVTAFYAIPRLRKDAQYVLQKLKEHHSISLLSGDNARQKKLMQQLLGVNSELLFEQQPIDKLQYIEKLQGYNKHVLMLGDGLNDAGALQQSNVGITLADDINNFTPSCDAILDASKFRNMPEMLRLSGYGRYIIGFSFFISIVYNIAGLSISIQGLMNPMIAAILMPVSTLSIVLITTGLSSLIAKRLGLSLRS